MAQASEIYIVLIDNLLKRKMGRKTFESALTRLEQITEEMENGNLSLDNSLKKFNEGVKLAEFCNERLSEARLTVEALLDNNGKLESKPFSGTESDD